MKSPRPIVAVLAGIAVVTAAVTAAGTRAGAQEMSTASPFRQGQWGIEAYAAGTPSGGVLLFLTPNTAFTLGVSALRTTSTDEFDTGSGRAKEEQTLTHLGASIGLRLHRPLAPRVLTTWGAGLAVERLTSKSVQSGPFQPATTTEGKGFAFGPFAEIGGQYMISDRFSAGTGFRVLWAKESQTYSEPGFPDDEAAGSTFSADFIPLRVTLYF